jgi:F-type H+-transporting ATPase subunit epsilon
VVTPERAVLDERADFVALPLFDGELGIAPGRAPLIGRLGQGELRVRAGGTTRRLFVDGGFAQVRDNSITILTSRAIPAESIDAAAAERDFATAQSIAARAPAEVAEKETAVRRARALIRLARKS